MVADPVEATYKTYVYLEGKVRNFANDSVDAIANADITNNVSSKAQRFWDKAMGNTPSFVMAAPPPPPRSPLDSIENFIKTNRKFVSILTIGLGIGGIYLNYEAFRGLCSKGRQDDGKRRVPKLTNGARKDVILMIGSPTEPLTRLIALDFERRGFIVYLTIMDEKDFKYIESNTISEDINYLNLNDSNTYEIQLNKFQRMLNQPVVPFPGADPHKLNLVGVVFTPNLYFPVGPIENIPMSSWSKLLCKFEVYLKLFSSGLISLIRINSSKTILINPTILSSTNLPYHSPESIFQNSLRSLFLSLSREISKQNLQVTQIRLGNLIISNQPVSKGKIENSIKSELLNWDEDMKLLYGDDFSNIQSLAAPIHGVKGTRLRELHHLLFDLIYSKKKNPSVVYCGTGARLYDFISGVVPERFIDWIIR